jgi:hypothetical protein
MKKICKTCKELQVEKAVEISGIIVDGGHYHWYKDIIFCPSCGCKVNYKRVRLRSKRGGC